MRVQSGDDQGLGYPAMIANRGGERQGRLGLIATQNRRSMSTTTTTRSERRWTARGEGGESEAHGCQVRPACHHRTTGPRGSLPRVDTEAAEVNGSCKAAETAAALIRKSK